MHMKHETMISNIMIKKLKIFDGAGLISFLGLTVVDFSAQRSWGNYLRFYMNCQLKIQD